MERSDLVDITENVEAEVGLNSDRIQRLMNDVRDAWNDYFWEYHFCQKEIRFTKEERTNHANDVFNYFEDVTALLSKVTIPGDYRSALPAVVSTLQFMFIQQDLIDELSKIFAIPQSSSEDKTLIRSIRNQLVGHPVSRDGDGQLVSTVFIMQQSHGGTLKYALYSKEKEFSSETKSYQWADLLRKHEDYLADNLNRILHKIDEVLKYFKRTLNDVSKNSIKMPFDKLVRWVGQSYAPFQNDNYLFSAENIIYCYERKDVHPRYQLGVTMFMTQLSDYLSETIRLIDEYINRKDAQTEGMVDLEIIRPVKIHYVNSETYLVNAYHDRYNNPIQKLHNYKNKHQLYTTDYFMGDFSNDEVLRQELEHMKVNEENAVEFYSAWEYFRELLQKRGLLRP